LAKAHLSAGQREAAVARIEEATRNASKIELPYTQAEALMAVGYIRSQLRNFASAEEAYQRAQDVYKRLGNLQGQYQTLSGLSRLHYLAGQSDKSLMTARAAWQLISSLDDPSQVRAARMELATALSENGFHAEAIEHMQAIVHEEPTATNIGNFGWVLYAAGEYARSLEQSRRALELDPSAVWVIRNIAHAYLATGRADDAEKEYKRAIQTRKGGEDFFESIRIVRKLASERPDLPRVREMLQMLEKEQSAIEG
jgi:tetratricopeptide (TPR) repeat protein